MYVTAELIQQCLIQTGHRNGLSLCYLVKSFLNSKENRENWKKLGVSLLVYVAWWITIGLCDIPCGIHMISKWCLTDSVNEKRIFDPIV